MFGHGQIEGFAEKYGMEYRRAVLGRAPGPVARRAPRARDLPAAPAPRPFAGVDDFLLYDFVADDGIVNEDVFAYSNRSGDERALVVYHNRYGSASGRIRESVPFAERVTPDPAAEKRLIRRTLADGLGLRVEDGWYAILRDRRSGLEYLRSTREIADGGLRLDLGAYECRVYLDLIEVADAVGRPYGRLASELGGRGVPSVEEAMRSILLRPVQDPLRRLLEPAAMESWRALAARRRTADRRWAPSPLRARRCRDATCSTPRAGSSVVTTSTPRHAARVGPAARSRNRAAGSRRRSSRTPTSSPSWRTPC